MSEEAVGLAALLFSVVMLAPLCIGVALAAADGRLPYNGGVGIRTRKTTQSAEAWRAGHAAALPVVGWLWWVAAGTVVMAVAAQWWTGGSWGIAAGLVGMFVECVVIFGTARIAGQAAGRAADGV